MTSRLDSDVIEGFDFAHDGRTFTCRVEAPGPERKEAWWWFHVSAVEADRHRYAPFRASATDTRASVESAIVAFYDDLVARRALPAASYWRRPAPRPATISN